MVKNKSSSRLRFSSEEKIFFVDVNINCRNDSWLSQDFEDVLVVVKTKFLAIVYVLGVISSEKFYRRIKEV